MFDVGFFELVVFAVIALIVLGPEKLPHAARMAGAWYARIRRTIANVQHEIAQEVNAQEIKAVYGKQQNHITASGKQLRAQFNSLDAIPSTINDIYQGSMQRIHPIDRRYKYYFLLSDEDKKLRSPPPPFKPNTTL